MPRYVYAGRSNMKPWGSLSAEDAGNVAGAPGTPPQDLPNGEL
jgi:hypothetical protein